MVPQRCFMSSASGPVINGLDSERRSNGTISPSACAGFRVISAGLSTGTVSSPRLRGSFKFFIVTSEYFDKQSSVVDQCLSQIFCGRFTALMARHEFARVAVLTGMVWIGRRDIGQTILRIVKRITPRTHDLVKQTFSLIHSPDGIIDELRLSPVPIGQILLALGTCQWANF